MNGATLNRQIATGRRLAMALEPHLAAVYASQFRKIGRQAAARFRTLAVAKPITAAGDDDNPTWVPPDVDELLNQPLADARAEDAATKLHLQAIELATPAAVRKLPGVSFEVDSPFAKPLLEAVGTKSVNLGLAARDVILKVIGDSYTAGLSVPATAAALQEGIGHLADTTALMVARTDLNGLANGAAHQSVQALGEEAPPSKQWLATEDERTRETHADADGQEVPLDQPFQVGDDLLMYPGDPDGSDAEILNCRCTVLYGDGPTPNEEAEVTASATTHEEVENTETSPRLELGVLAAAAGQPIPWRAILIVEGEETADGRIIDPGAIDWRELPLTLMAMTETDDGHDGAIVAGRIDNIYRDFTLFDDARTAIVGEGVFDTGDYGQEIARLVADQTLRGVSADMGNVEIVVEMSPPTYRVGDDEYEAGVETAELIHYVKGTLLGATVCPFPAIGSGAIEIADAQAVVAAGLETTIVRVLVPAFGEETIGTMTAAAAGAVPAAPPAAWFKDPKLDGPTPLTVTDEGRLFGHVATWGVCHIGNPQGPNVCTTAPRSASDYAFFHLGELETAEGELISVGQITLDTDHAPLALSAQASQRHYADTGVSASYARCGEDRYGIWAAGALADELPVTKIRKLRAAKLSGDWRKINGRVEMIGVLAVNIPGFPIPRPATKIRASAGEPEVLSLVAAGILGETAPSEEQTRARIAALAARALGRDELIALALGDSTTGTSVTWDTELGVMDVMGDIAADLNPGEAWRWWVVDLAIGGGSAIICDGDSNDYYLVPLTYDADSEPVLPPTADWVEVKSEWVEASETAAQLTTRAMASRHAMPAAAEPVKETASRWANRVGKFFTHATSLEAAETETLAADAPVVVTETAARDLRNPPLLSGNLDEEIALQVDFLRDHGYYSDEPLSQFDLERAELREAQRLASFLVVEPTAIQSVALQSRLIDKGLIAAAVEGE